MPTANPELLSPTKTSISPQAILTVDQMRGAEQALIEKGISVETLMQRAGTGAAEWVWRLSGGGAVTVLCGPGNNGGDGYVIAEDLRQRGCDVAVLAPIEPRSAAAITARAAYQGPYSNGRDGRVLVDCLFGSGLNRPLSKELAQLLVDNAQRHKLVIAVDVPSGLDADRAVPLADGTVTKAGVTLALGAWKRAHHLQPGRHYCGQLRLVDIGLSQVEGAAELIARPQIKAPSWNAHKYSRGLCLIVAGEMLGASLLSSHAAMNAGAGYVKLLGPQAPAQTPPELVVDSGDLADALLAKQAGAVLVGQGLGRSPEAQSRLQQVLETGDAPLVVDGDALHFLNPAHTDLLTKRQAVLTPHAAELEALCRAFGISEATSVQTRALALAKACGAVIVAKGPDSFVAAPDGQLAVAPQSSEWLSVAGTGDVLAGVLASRRATGQSAFAAACEAVWLHARAAQFCAVPFTAAAVARAIPAAIQECL